MNTLDIINRIKNNKINIHQFLEELQNEKGIYNIKYYEEINASKLLEKAWRAYNIINEDKDLLNVLDYMVYLNLKEYNLSYNVIETIFNSYKLPYSICPLDILVNDDIVFLKYASLNDGFIERIDYKLLSNNYYEVLNIDDKRVYSTLKPEEFIKNLSNKKEMNIKIINQFKDSIIVFDEIVTYKNTNSKIEFKNEKHDVFNLTDKRLIKVLK